MPHPTRDLRYQFFINIFNIQGKYSEKFAPSFTHEGFSKNTFNKWIENHRDENPLLKKASSTFFKFPTPLFTSYKQIDKSIEEHRVTHLLIEWSYWDFLKYLGGHAVGLSIYKDLSNNYHIIYLNKGARKTPITTLEWYYVPSKLSDIVEELIEAADTSTQDSIEESIYKLSGLKGTLLINTFQPQSQKRGSCVVSNSIKSVVRSEAMLSAIEHIDLTKFLKEDSTNSIFLDRNIQFDILEKFKGKTYENKWVGAYEFCALFESMEATPNKSILSILLYQAFYNLFQKERFNEELSEQDEEDIKLKKHKLILELKYIRIFFNRCIQSNFHESALILLIHLSKKSLISAEREELFSYALEIILALPEIKIQDAIIDIIIQDLIVNINEYERENVYIQLLLLEKLKKQNQNSFLEDILIAFKNGSIDTLQSKISTPIHYFSFMQCAMHYAIKEERFSDIDDLFEIMASILPIMDDNQDEEYSILGDAIISDKISVVNHLFQKGEVDLNINSALALAAKIGSLEIYKFLFAYQYSMYLSANKKAWVEFDANVNNLHIVDHFLTLDPKLIPYDTLVSWLKFVSLSSRLDLAEKILSIQKFEEDIIFTDVAIPATIGGSLTILAYLFANNLVTINQCHPHIKSTLLHYASFSKNPDIYDFLCQKNPDHFAKTAENKGAYIPLQLAATLGRFKVVNYYLDNYFEQLSPDAIFSCLKFSVLRGNMGITERLMQEHQFTQAQIQEIFDQSMIVGNLHIAQYFKDKGAAINPLNKSTHLDLAVVHGRRMLDFLYQNRFDVRAKRFPPESKTGNYSYCYNDWPTMIYLFDDAIKRCYTQYKNAKKDESYQLLKEFEKLINSNKHSISQFKAWLDTLIEVRTGGWLSGFVEKKTRANIFFNNPIIKDILEPLLMELLEAYDKNDSSLEMKN